MEHLRILKPHTLTQLLKYAAYAYGLQYELSTYMRVDCLPETTSIAQNVWLAEKAKQNM